MFHELNRMTKEIVDLPKEKWKFRGFVIGQMLRNKNKKSYLVLVLKTSQHFNYHATSNHDQFIL